MAYRFKTYTELGEAIKAAKPEYAERNAESLGLQFADKYGDQYEVRVEEEEERAPFAYDPEEGFNVLKTLGNVPWSAGQVVGDIATAVTSPLETIEGLGRGAAGAAEMAMGTEYSPENIRMAQQMGEGIAGMAGFEKKGDDYEFTGRGIQERPLDAGSLLAGGAGAAAKGVSMAGKATGLSRLAKGAQTAGKAAQMADPVMAVPRAGIAAARGAGRLAAGGVKVVGNKLMVQPLRRRFKGSRAGAAMDDMGDFFDGLKENAGPAFDARWAQLMTGAAEKMTKGKERALDWLTRAQKTAERKVGEAVGEISAGTAAPVTGGGVLQGLLQQTLGFTTGLGPRLIERIIEISKLDDPAGRNIMLRATNKDYKPGSGAATIGEEVVEELARDVEKWSKARTEASRITRDALRMNDVKASTNDLKLAIINDTDLRNNFGIRIRQKGERIETTLEPGTVMGEAVPLSPRTDIGPQGRGPANQPPFVDRMMLDMEGRPIGESGGVGGQVPTFTVEDLRNVNIDLGGSPILDLGENVSAVNQAFQKVFKLPENATVRQLDIAKRAIDDAIEATPGTANAALTRLRGMVYDRITSAYNDPNVLRRLGIPEGLEANPYVQAMAQYEAYVTRLNALAKSLKVKDTQVKFAGTPLEVIRQTGNPQEVVKAVLNAFGDNDSELAMSNLMRLLEETGNTTLLPKIVGFSMRPVFGGGLVVRSEISQIGRGLLGFQFLSTMMAPVAMLGFSPKYGGMVLSYMFSPKGQKRVRGLPGEARRAVEQRLPGVVERAKAVGSDIKRMAAEKFGKKPKDVTPNEIAAVEEDIGRMQQVMGRVDREEVTRIRSLIRGGAMEQRAEQAGERSQQRNVLTSLANVQR
jgi:hypothetical protein